MDGHPLAAWRRVAGERGWLDGLLAGFAWFALHPGWRRAILGINFGGIAYGIWYYVPQFSVTPWYLWPMVPDSPLAILWATLALLAIGAGRRRPALEGLAIVGNIEVGLWTAFVLSYYDRVTFPRLDWFLFWLHLAMIALALVFVAALRWGPRREAAVALSVAGGWYALNAWADYWFPLYAFEGCAGLHPISIHPLRNPCAGLDVVAWVTVGLTVLAVATLAVLALGAQSQAPITGRSRKSES